LTIDVRLFGIIALSVALGAGSMAAFLSWQQRTSPAAVATQQIEKSESARQKLRVLQTEMRDALRAAEKESPEKQHEAWLSWQKAHGEEMKALRHEIAAAQPRRLTVAPTMPSNLSEEQKVQWQQRQNWRQKHQQLTELMSQAPSAEREKQIAQLRQEIHAEQTMEMRKREREQEAALTPAERARRQELETLQRQRSELLISLRSAKPAARRLAMEKWEKENGSKLRILLPQSPAGEEAKVKVFVPTQSGITNRPAARP
jgi:superfamily II DNA helicase RecQ